MVIQDHFIEQLSEVASFRGFLTFSTQQFALHIEQLIQRVFRKTDFALKSVVDSLFENQGPLAELPVRLKLLLGLGVISVELYQDIQHFLEMETYLDNEMKDYAFTQIEVIQFTQSLHQIDLSIVNQWIQKAPFIENKDSMQHQIQQARMGKIIRSALILVVSKMIEQLNIESPL